MSDASAAPEADDELPPLRPGLWDAALFVLVLSLYALTSSTTLQGHDNPEWVSLSVLGGQAHPPGYPLYSALLRLVGALPLPFHAVWRTSLLSSVLMALAVVVLARALVERNEHVFTARISALMFALSLPAWRMAGVAEVFAGLALNAAALLWVLHWIDNAEELKPRHGIALGASLGAGVAHHHAVALLLPLVVTHVFLSHRGAGARRFSVATLGGLVAGIAVLTGAWALWLAIPSDADAYRFTSVSDLGSIADTILRREYGTLSSSKLSGGWSIAATWDLLKDTAGAFHVTLPLAIYALKARRARPIALCWLLAGPWLLGTFTVVQADGSSVLAPHETRERFEVLALMLTAVLANDALAALGFELPARRRAATVRAHAAFLVVAVVVAGAITLPLASWRGEAALDRTLHTAVQTAPEDSVVIVAGDAWQMGFGLVAHGIGRRDLLALDFPRSFTGGRFDPRGAELLSSTCGAPCPPERWADALSEIARNRPVMFFPALAGRGVLGELPASVDGLFSRLGAGTTSLKEQALALQAFQRDRIPGPLRDSRRHWEGHAIAIWAEPWMLLLRQATQAPDPEVAAIAAQELQRIRGLVMSGSSSEITGANTAAAGQSPAAR